ncbi:MAG: DMT family transporter [Candidatus Dormibacteraeota bacterium]|uniref:DMT family transporter n=1 Tax=Candidatus Aeolococcus gillhamiae TaxID=3127015 RepID=A0A934K0T6_9BACT|nr:DMT family transporter [Candidatus Dormibacteraeota bacterium]
MSGEASAGSYVDRTGVALTALSAAFFGSLAIYGKFADRIGIPLVELLAIRFVVAAVLLWTLAVARRERLWWGWRSAGLALMGMLYVGQAATYFTSLRTVPAAVTSILLYLYPVIVVLLAAAFLGERLTRMRVLALVLAVAGVFAVVNPISANGSLDTAGLLFGLAAAAIYAGYILTGRVLLRDVPAVVATAGIATTAGVTLTIAGLIGGQFTTLSGAGWGLTTSMAVVATAIPATMFLAGLARVGAARAAIISTLEPATTVVLAALLLGEDLGVVRLLGGAVILVAAVIVARRVPTDLAEVRVHR